MKPEHMIHLSVFDLSKIDAFAVTIAVVGYLVVFIALVLLYAVFSNLPALLEIDLMSFAGGKKSPGTTLKKDEVKVTGEVNAAIGMAIYLYLSDIHDQESGVLTIKKISKRYSPWSSKIYGLRQHPRN